MSKDIRLGAWEEDQGDFPDHITLKDVERVGIEAASYHESGIYVILAKNGAVVIVDRKSGKVSFGDYSVVIGMDSTELGFRKLNPPFNIKIG